MAERQFESLADRVLSDSFTIFEQKRLALRTMSSMVANIHPDAEKWPFVTVPGWEETTTNLLQATKGDDMGLIPIVHADQVEEYENFAYKFYFEDRDPPFENNTAGVAPFGRGIWAMDFSTGVPYHDNMPGTTYGSSYPNIKTPVIHTDDSPNIFMMYNLHSDESRGSIIDGSLDCINKRLSDDLSMCQTVSSMVLSMMKWEHAIGPGAGLVQPIFPRNDPENVTGFIGSTFLFEELLNDAFATLVSGVDCVAIGPNQAFTYTVNNGVLEARGLGDMHDATKKGFCRSLTGEVDDRGFYTAQYDLCLYPTDEFVNAYSTANPVAATFGAVLVILLTSLMFFVYDRAVAREFHSKKELLEAKRRFMRFVSHEVWWKSYDVSAPLLA